ncbi:MULTISPECIES: hypothetical protein [Streptomyces]|uniref:hypothetical protein n=1 Tax=Streptomyces TaxID=1883 RepID=UPI000789A621|nr:MULTISPECIES: hypothetical protein [unclassified Streptomyces]AVH95712.1 hypothetical protein C5L38_12055 [Streptomyces sp. WAC00288]KYG54385.1 hypothetical protein AWI43_07875 [Streptomyces sp. WAC04657]
MTRAMRWLVTVVAAAATFGVCVWVVRAVSWGWLPQGEGPRLDTALAFGTVTAGAVLAVGIWWSSRERPPAPVPHHTVTQEATASGNSRIAQAGGPQSTNGAPFRVGQHAEASDDGTITQTGGGAAEVDQRAKASGRGHIAQAGGDQQVEGP